MICKQKNFILSDKRWLVLNISEKKKAKAKKQIQALSFNMNEDEGKHFR